MKKLIFMLFCMLMVIACKKEPVADFSFPSTTKVGESIQFTNSSTNSDSHSWDFGDGSTSTEESPSHTYEKPGDYTVTLKTTGEGGTSTKTKSITITGITYAFKNNTSATLYSFSTYYWDGEDTQDWTEHGNLAPGATTDAVITERIEIDFGFYSSSDETTACISPEPYSLIVNTHNEIIIDGSTQVYCNDVKSESITNLKDNNGLIDKINAIRLLLNPNTE